MGGIVGSVADIAIAALQADQDRLRVISQNLTNTSTPGYRAEIPSLGPGLSFSSYVDGLDQGASIRAQQREIRSERPGAMQQTDRSLDVALEGAGYFELMGEGSTAYTRRGDFHIDRNGVLRGARDLPVLGTGGQIVLPDAGVSILANGEIQKDGATVGQLSIAHFAKDAGFQYAGDGLFFASENPITADDQLTNVRQGFIEAANVQPMVEMTHLLETSRHFGASAQALKAYDQMLDAALTGLGE